MCDVPVPSCRRAVAREENEREDEETVIAGRRFSFFGLGFGRSGSARRFRSIPSEHIGFRFRIVERAHPGVERQRGAPRTDDAKDDDRGCRSGSRRRRRTTPDDDDDDAWDGARGDARGDGDDGGGERGAKESRTLERFGRGLGVVRAASGGGPRARPAPRAGKGSGRARTKVFAG